MMIFATTLAHIKAVALFTGTKDARKYINVAYAEPAADGARVVAYVGPAGMVGQCGGTVMRLLFNLLLFLFVVFMLNAVVFFWMLP